MDKLFTIFYYTLATLALGFGTMLVLMQTDILPGYDVRIVQSGSMEPAISTGSVVVIQARERYQVGDVVTFGGNDARSQLPTTHRIIEDRLQDGELIFITQGDANESPDIDPTRPDDIRGAVILDIPYLGFVLDFARQPLGFALLIGLPAAFIVFEEGSTIYRVLRSRPEDQVGERVVDKTVTEQTPDSPTDTSPESASVQSAQVPDAPRDLS